MTKRGDAFFLARDSVHVDFKALKRSPKGVQVGFGEIKISFSLGPRKTLSHQCANGNEDGNGNEQFDQTEGASHGFLLN